MKSRSKNGRINPNLPIFDRFWARVNKTDGCWDWVGSKTTLGYGTVMIDRKYQYAHRLSYKFANGEIPKGLVVRHLCHNPSCVNPKHLIIGTQAENISDSVKDNRNPAGENHNFNKFKKEIIKEIRVLYETGKYTQKELCDMFKMSPGNLNHVVRYKIWKRYI